MTADGRPGLWTYVMELVRALAGSHVEVVLAVMGPELLPEQKNEAAGLGNCRFCFRPFAAEWMPDPWPDVARTGDWLLTLEEHLSPKIVHLNHYCHGSLPWTAPVLISAHGCLLSAWQAVHGEPAPRAWTRYHAEVAAGVRGANMVAASTEAMADSLLQLYAPIPKLLHCERVSRFPELRTIPHGLDGERYRPMEKRELIFCPANAGDERLNLEMLNAVAEKISWPVYAAGTGSLPAIHWLSSSKEANPCRAQAAVFAAPSRYEPFGFEPLKAALSGCALVLGDIPSLRETWGDAALFAPADCERGFGEALREITGDPKLRAEMAGRARRRALQLTPESMAESTLECYQRLLASQVAACGLTA